jgi:hypothetical protein
MKRTALVVAGLVICAGGCTVEELPQPDYRSDSPVPVEHRVVRTYRYYPDSEVYYDPMRRIYFWPDSGSWIEGRRLPTRFRGRLGDFVEITIDSDEPHQTHSMVESDYPSGTAQASHSGR